MKYNDVLILFVDIDLFAKVYEQQGNSQADNQHDRARKIRAALGQGIKNTADRAYQKAHNHEMRHTAELGKNEFDQL